MRDVLSDERTDGTPPGEYPVGDADAARIRDGLEGQQVCPFCGLVSDGSQAICGKCTMENSAVARKATKLRIGPWYVLQHRNPAAPGMKWETLLAFVRKGRVKPPSIVRGPTTHQLWRFAAHVKGLSREFGVCFSCGGCVERSANLCPHCNRLQEPPINPDTLLEGGEVEQRLPVFKEISPPPVPQADDSELSVAPEPPADSLAAAAAMSAALAAAAEAEAEAEARRKLREQEETLAREREAVAREREAAEQEKLTAARELESIRRDQEAIARDREAVLRDKESIEKDRSALARERESVRREREMHNAAAATPVPVPNNVQPAATWDAEATTPPKAPPPAREEPPAAPDTLVWDLPESDASRHRPAASQPSRPAAAPTRPAATEPARQAAPQASRPAASSPAERTPGPGGSSPKPRTQTPRDGFLSAKDLAAAFRLNLAPGVDYDLAAPPREVAQSVDSFFSQEPPRPSRAGRKLLIVSLVLIAALAATFAASQDLRDKARAVWLQISDQSPSPRSGTIAPKPRDDDDASDTQTPERSTANPNPGGPTGSTQPPARSPSSQAQPVSAANKTGAAAKPSVPVTPTPAAVSAQDVKLAKSLLAQAKEIEGTNLDEAIKLLEKIAQLPRAAWPSGFEDELKIARKQKSER